MLRITVENKAVQYVLTYIFTHIAFLNISYLKSQLQCSLLKIKYYVIQLDMCMYICMFLITIFFVFLISSYGWHSILINIFYKTEFIEPCLHLFLFPRRHYATRDELFFHQNAPAPSGGRSRSMLVMRASHQCARSN